MVLVCFYLILSTSQHKSSTIENLLSLETVLFSHILRSFGLYNGIDSSNFQYEPISFGCVI
jgi:hypothetical protein